MTQEALAAAVGVNTDTIGKWENADPQRKGPQLANVIALAAVLEVSIDQLIKGDEAYGAALKRELGQIVDEKMAELERRLDERLKRAGL